MESIHISMFGKGTSLGHVEREMVESLEVEILWVYELWSGLVMGLG